MKLSPANTDDIIANQADEIRLLEAENERLRAATKKLIASAKPCPHCPPEAECYIFSMTALADAGQVVNRT